MYVVASSLHTDCPIMLINQHIGNDADAGMGVDGAAFQRELLDLDNNGHKCIRVWINSPGGVVMDGYNIYNAILNTKTPVDTYCTGMAASIAAVIFQAGRKRIMADYSRLMFHNPFGSDDKKALNAISSSIATMIATRSGKTQDDVTAMMDKTTWIVPEDALTHGLCDSIEMSNERNIPRAANAKNFYLEANKIINSIFNNDLKTASMSLSKITNILKLNPEASEDAIVQEINSLNNRATKAEMRKKELEDELKSLNDTIEEEKAAKAKLKADMEQQNRLQLETHQEEIKAKDLEMKNKLAEFEQLKLEKKNNEAAAHLAKCTNMVKGYAAQGRIKNEEAAINKWVNKAIADFEGTEELIKELPLNKAAVTIKNEANVATGSLTAAGVMAQVLARNSQTNN